MKTGTTSLETKAKINSVVMVIEIGIETAVLGSIDGFSFLVKSTALMSGAVNVRPNSTQLQ